MTSRLTAIGASLSILGFLTWLVLESPGRSARDGPAGQLADDNGPQEHVLGSELPCAVPVAWQVARLDPGFGLSQADASHAVEQAAALWEVASGLQLFTHDRAEGFPIHFVYDERQARQVELTRLERGVREERSHLERRRTELDAVRTDVGLAQAAYEERLSALQERIERHNVAIRQWQDAEEVPDDVLEELRISEDALHVDREAIEEARRALELRRSRLEADEDVFTRAAHAHNRSAEALASRFPLARVDAGIYNEVVRTDDDGAVTVSREIRIYRFAGRDDLVRILAHELGHALGLEHDSAPGSIMSEQYGREDRIAGSAKVQPTDIEALRARCPELRF